MAEGSQATSARRETLLRLGVDFMRGDRVRYGKHEGAVVEVDGDAVVVQMVDSRVYVSLFKIEIDRL